MVNSPPSHPVLHLTKHVCAAVNDHSDVARCELFASVLVRLLTSGIMVSGKTYYLSLPLLIIDSGGRERFAKIQVEKAKIIVYPFR